MRLSKIEYQQDRDRNEAITKKLHTTQSSYREYQTTTYRVPPRFARRTGFQNSCKVSTTTSDSPLESIALYEPCSNARSSQESSKVAQAWLEGQASHLPLLCQKIAGYAVH
eukprot:6178429-Pleurochrysis_carterae.AAC.2